MVDLSIARHRQTEGRQRLLAKPKAVEPDTPQDHRDYATSILTPFAGNVPESPHDLAYLGGLLASTVITSCFMLSPQNQLFMHIDTDIGYFGYADFVLQALKVLAPTRIFGFSGWGTTIYDVAMLEHTISFRTHNIPPLLIKVLHRRNSPDLGPYLPFLYNLGLGAAFADRLPL